MDLEDARASVIALAFSGNIETFQTLLDKKDPVLLSTYAMSYRNRNGKKCIDPVIEKTIASYIDDPVIGDVLLSFFVMNLYQSKELFERLVERKLDLKKPKSYNATVLALVSTNQEGIEEEVLEHARKFPLTPVKETLWIHPAIERFYIEYFTRRKYVPAVQYMQSILDTQYYKTVPDNFKNDLAMRRRVIYLALDNFPSSVVEDIYINQLAKLTRMKHDVFFMYELESLGKFSVKHAESEKQFYQITKYLSDILKAVERADETTDKDDTIKSNKQLHLYYQIRKITIGLLEDISSDASLAVIVQELQRQSDNDDNTYADRLIRNMLDSLKRAPSTITLDVPGFLKACRKLEASYRLLNVPEILKKYPHPDGHSYLLSHLEFILSYDENLMKAYGFDRKGAFDYTIVVLLTFDEPEYLLSSRAVLDNLFKTGTLDEDLYVSASESVNSLIGDESPDYMVLFQKKEAEQEEKRKQLAREAEEKWLEPFKQTISENLSPEGIKKNIRLLSQHGNDAKTASKWLVMAGTDILPYAHEALLNPGSDMRFKIRLINVLGPVGDKSSIGPIIKTVRENAENPGIYKDVFLSLGHIPMTKESFEFASELIEKSRDPSISQSVLVYFALKRESRALKWAKHFSTGADTSVRSAALFLSARLGSEQVKEQIVALIEERSARSDEEILLRALAELTTPEEFKKLAASLNLDKKTNRYHNALWISEFREASINDKTIPAEKLLMSGTIWDTIDTARYFIETNQTEIIKRHIFSDPRVELPLIMEAMQSTAGIILFNEARKMGYRIEEIPEGIRLLRK